MADSARIIYIRADPNSSVSAPRCRPPIHQHQRLDKCKAYVLTAVPTTEMTTEVVYAPTTPSTRRASDCTRQRRCSNVGHTTAPYTLTLPTFLNIATCFASASQLLAHPNADPRFNSIVARTSTAFRPTEFALATQRMDLLPTVPTVTSPHEQPTRLRRAHSSAPLGFATNTGRALPRDEQQSSRSLALPSFLEARKDAPQAGQPPRRVPKLSRTKEID